MTGQKKGGGVDRTSFEPVYMQIVRLVSQKIAGGLLHPGDQLPTESQFCKEFDVSPMTVRRAIKILVERGAVAATQGRGTFVRSPRIGQAVFSLRELEERWSQAEEAMVRLLEASILSADDVIAAHLAIAPGERVVYIRRIVLNENTPTMYHREYIVYDPRRPLVETQLQITSFEGLFQGNDGEGVSRGDLVIDAVNVTADEGELLKVPRGSAAFRLEHVLFDFRRRPVSWGWFICRPDRFTLAAHIGANADL